MTPTLNISSTVQQIYFHWFIARKYNFSLPGKHNFHWSFHQKIKFNLVTRNIIIYTNPYTKIESFILGQPFKQQLQYGTKFLPLIKKIFYSWSNFALCLTRLACTHRTSLTSNSYLIMLREFLFSKPNFAESNFAIIIKKFLQSLTLLSIFNKITRQHFKNCILRIRTYNSKLIYLSSKLSFNSNFKHKFYNNLRKNLFLKFKFTFNQTFLIQMLSSF